MSDQLILGEPGVRAARTATPRHVFLTSKGAQFLPGLRRISGAASRDPGNAAGDIGVLRPGVLMGKIASVVNSLGTVGHYAPSALGLTTNAEAAGSTAVEASAAVVTELLRRVGASGTFKLIGPPTAGGTIAIETVTYSAASGTTITVTALVNAFVASSIIAPTDGSESPITFIAEEMMGGVQVVDVDGTTNLTVEFAKLAAAGQVDFPQLLPAVADASTKAWIVSKLNEQAGGQFIFPSLKY